MRKKRILAGLCLIAVLVSGLSGCKKKKKDTTLYVATVGGEKITRPVFASMFNTELSVMYQESSGKFSFDDFGTEAFYDRLCKTKTEEGGITYYDDLVEKALDQSQLFTINLILAKKDSSWPSDKELKEKRETAKSGMESGASQYGFSSAEEFCIYYYGIPLSDYMEFYGLSYAVDAFNDHKRSDMALSDEELAAYFETVKDDPEYKKVKVRHSLFNTEELSAEDKAAVLEKVNGYLESYKAGTMTADEIVALSEDPGVKTNDGYYDVTEADNFVTAFKEWALSQEAASDELAVVETEYGYHVMQCVEVSRMTLSDEQTKANVQDRYTGDKLDEELTALQKDSRYAIKDRQDDTIAKFVKQLILGDFEEETDDDATAEPTEAPKEYNDAAASTEKVATLGDMDLWYSEYTYFFNSAITSIIGSDLVFDEDSTTAEQYQQLRAFLDTQYKDEGITYLEKCKEKAMEQMKQFKLTWLAASEEFGAYTEEEIETINADLDSMVDQYLSYYGPYMNLTTRDEMVQYMMGMNVNEYKRMNLQQTRISEYADKKMEAMEPAEAELKAFYGAHEADYRTVTVRHLFLSLQDEEGNAVSAAKKEEVRLLADRLMEKLRGGESAEVLVTGYSESESASTDLGLADLTKNAKTLDSAIVSWAVSQTKTGLSTLKLFETKTGYEIVFVEGILTYEKQDGITADAETMNADALKEAVLSDYKNDAFQKHVEALEATSDLKLENVNEELINRAVEAYLTYEEEDGEE